MSPQAAAVATALALVSCSGIRQNYHGNRETEQENTTERDGWMEGSDEVMFVGYSTWRLLKGSILGFLFLEIPGFILFLIVFIFHRPNFLYCNLFSLFMTHIQALYFHFIAHPLF